MSAVFAIRAATQADREAIRAVEEATFARADDAALVAAGHRRLQAASERLSLVPGL